MYIIYSKDVCPYCDQAKALLKSKGLEYKEYTLNLGKTMQPGKTYVTLQVLQELVPSVKTVPQIFKDDVYIGGFTELKASLQ